MKTLPYILVFVLLIACKSTNQEIDWSLLTDANHFAGFWVGSTDGTDSLVIKLEVIKSHKPVMGRYIDRLAGQYAYYKNGQLVESSFNAEEYALYPIGLFASEKIKNKHLSFQFKSYPDDNKGVVRISLAKQYPNDGVWELAHPGIFNEVIHIRIVGEPEKPKEEVVPFNIPTKITLRKLES